MNNNETEQIRENLRLIMAEKGIKPSLNRPVYTIPKPKQPPKKKQTEQTGLTVRKAVLVTIMVILSVVALIKVTVDRNKKPQPTPSIQSSSSLNHAPADPVASPVVRNEGPAGTVWQVTEYVLAHLKDPDSFRTIKWGNVVETSGKFAVRLNYRAKNSFGGLVVSDEVFFLDEQGHVVGSMTTLGTQ